MSTRTANWVSRTTPGRPPPPPPSRPMTAPPTIYPESSVSNPNASRYTGRPSPTSSQHSSRYSRGRSTSTTHSSSHVPSRASSHSSHRTARDPQVQTFYAETEQPIIARTSSANGRTSSYMIIPAAGQKVEILHPTPVRSQSVPYTTTTYQKEKPLIKRLFDRIEWGSGSGISKTSGSRTATRIPRRNSTGGSTVVTSSGTRITSGSGRVYEVHYA